MALFLKYLSIAAFAVVLGLFVTTTTNAGPSNLVVASSEGDLAQVEALLAAKADVNVHGYRGLTPLMAASDSGRLVVLRVLLAAGADVNAHEDDGGTALMLAAQEGQTDAARVLLAARADVNAKRPDGATALYLAVTNNRLETLRLLIDAHADVDVRSGRENPTPLMIAALHGYANIAQALIAAKAHVNARADDGATALMAASWDIAQTFFAH